MKKLLPDIIAILAFVVISFVYFFPADIEGRILFQHDSAAGAGAGRDAQEILNVLVNVAAGQTRFSVVCLPTRWLRVMIRQNLCLGWRRLINFTFRSM